MTVAGITGSMGHNASQLNQPIDIAVTSLTTLYVVEYANHRAQKWTIGASSGRTVAGQANASFGSNSADLYFPTGIYVDSDENMYIADGRNYRVQLWLKDASDGSTVAGTGK